MKISYLLQGVIFPIVILLFIYGCNRSVLDGKATPPEFDSGPHIFGKEGSGDDGKIIESKNDEHWSFQGITINGIYTCGYINKDCGIPDEFLYCYSSNIDENDLPVRIEPKYPVKKYYECDGRNHSLVSGDRFSIEQLDKRHIRIKMGENKTGEDISIAVHIFAGDAIENDILIEQKAK